MHRRPYRTAILEGIAGEDNGSVTRPLYTSVPAVAKTNERLAYQIPNEFICGRIGQFLGLPVPPGGLSNIDPKSHTLAYTCYRFDQIGEDLPDVIPGRLALILPLQAAGTVIFDILIANPDRHARNMAAILEGDRPFYMLFDHGHSLFGWGLNRSVARLSDLKGRLGISAGAVTGGNRHCLLDCITTDVHFTYWIERIEQIPDFFIADVAKELRDLNLLSDVETTAVVEFLKDRRDNIRTIIDNHRAQFTGIIQPSLL